MHLRKVHMLFVALIGAVLLAAPAYAQDGEGDPERGAQVYAENCLACHGEQGSGRAAALNEKVFASIAPSVLMEQMIRGGVQGTFMIPFDQAQGGPLSDQDIADVIAYINTWNTASEPPLPASRPPAQEIPPVAEVSGDPNEGYVLFQENCAVCHGESGEGRTGTSLQVAFASIQPGQFARSTIERGVEGSLMPAWGDAYGGPLNGQQIDDVVAYILSIQSPAPEAQPAEVRQVSSLPIIMVLAVVLVVLVFLGMSAARPRSQDKP